MPTFHLALTTELDDTNVLHFSFATPRALVHWLRLRARRGVRIQRIVALTVR